jgi:hypothetical protein
VGIFYWNAPYFLAFARLVFLNDIASPEFDCYRLVLISGTTKLILLDATQVGADLPRVFVPRWTRTTEQIQTIAKERWGLSVLVAEFLGDEPGGDGVVVAEALDEGKAHRPHGYLWRSLGEIDGAIISHQERAVLGNLLRDGRTDRGPFYRLGWIRGLYEWIDSTSAVDRGCHFTSDVKQLNASPTSTLLRLRRKDAKVYWFKAAGPPNAHEGPITSLLAGLFPGYLPAMIASHDEWNGWLMEDAGSPLDGLRSIRLPTLEHVVRRLAELQRASADHIPAMLMAGCRDQRTPALLAGIHELLPYLHEAMAMQRLDSVPRIDFGRLRNIEEVLEQACFGLEWIGVPNSLIHGDIHLGNILVNGRKCVFTDWARASVGNPFVTFAQLRDQLAHERRTHAWLPQLTRAYQEVWEPVLPDFLIRRAFSLIPMIASASYLYGRRELLISEHGKKPQFQRYVRSLVRQMDKAARSLEESLTICA